MKWLLCAFLFLSLGTSFADEQKFFNERIATAFEAVGVYNKAQDVRLSGVTSKFEIEDNFVAFTDEMPLLKPVDSPRDPDKAQQTFSVRTTFLRKSPTIEKRVHVRQGPEEFSRMRFIFHPAQKKEHLAQYTFKDDGQAWQIYEGASDVFFYTQKKTKDNEVELKEWIYAEMPNHRRGSVYEWDLYSEEFNRFLEMDAGDDGSVSLKRHVMVGGVDPKDKEEQKRVVGVVRTAMKNIPVYIHGEDVIGRIEPVRYWTREGIAKTGSMRVKNATHLTVSINEPPSSYPLVIDPAIVVGSEFK